MEEFGWNNVLSSDMRKLLAIVGDDLFYEIMQEFKGQCVYFPVGYAKEYRNFLIQRDYFEKGICIREIAKKWNLSISGIKYILNKPIEE